MTKFNRDALIGILKAIDNTIKTDAKFNKFLLLVLQKNRKKLVDIATDVEAREKALYTEEYTSYEKARIALVKTYADKDEDGELITDSNGNAKVRDEYITQLNSELAVLNDRFKNTLETYDSERTKFVEYVTEEIEIDFAKTDFKNLPDEVSSSTFELLSLFVNDEGE